MVTAMKKMKSQSMRILLFVGSLNIKFLSHQLYFLVSVLLSSCKASSYSPRSSFFCFVSSSTNEVRQLLKPYSLRSHAYLPSLYLCLCLGLSLGFCGSQWTELIDWTSQSAEPASLSRTFRLCLRVENALFDPKTKTKYLFFWGSKRRINTRFLHEARRPHTNIPKAKLKLNVPGNISARKFLFLLSADRLV